MQYQQILGMMLGKMQFIEP